MISKVLLFDMVLNKDFIQNIVGNYNKKQGSHWFLESLLFGLGLNNEFVQNSVGNRNKN